MSISRSAILSINELRDYVENLVCPITYEVMQNPMIAADGHTYEEAAIKLWIQQCKTLGKAPSSPLTGAPLTNETLTRNAALLPFLDRLHSLSSAPPPTLSTATAVASAGSEALTSKVFEELDRVMNLDLAKSLGLRFAQVVVVGMESHGKSTLLERLVGLPLFPKNRTRCTTCPIRVQLRRNPRQITTIYIRRRETEEEHPASKSIIAMENICAEVNRLMKWITTTLEPQVVVSMQYEIVICIQQPFVPNLDVLDLPGLVGANLNTTSQDLVSVTAELARSVIKKEKDRSVFLLVMDCRTQTNHSIATQLISTGGVEAQTIGVMTKLDMYRSEEEDVDPASDPLLQKLVSKTEMLTTHGWLLCSNRIPARETYKSDIDRLEIMEAREKELLARDYASFARSGRVGLPAIRGAVQKLFEDFLCHEWIPRIVFRLLEESCKLMDQHLSYGSPMPDDTSGIAARNRIVEALGRFCTSTPPLFKATCSPRTADEFKVVPHANLISDFVAAVGKSASHWVRLERTHEVWTAMDAFNDLVKSIEDNAGVKRKEYFRTSHGEGSSTKATGANFGVARDGSLATAQFLNGIAPELCGARQVVRERVVPSLERLVNTIHTFLTSPLMPQMLQMAIQNDTLSTTSGVGGGNSTLLQLEVKNVVEIPALYRLTKAQFSNLVLFNANIAVNKLLDLSESDFANLKCTAVTGAYNPNGWNINDLAIPNDLIITHLQLEWLLQMAIKQCGCNLTLVNQYLGNRTYGNAAIRKQNLTQYYPQYNRNFSVLQEFRTGIHSLVAHMKSNDTMPAYQSAKKEALTDEILGTFLDNEIRKTMVNSQISDTTKAEVDRAAETHKATVRTIPRTGKVKLNCGRFPKLLAAVQGHVGKTLTTLAATFRDECMEEIHDLAKKEHGFFVTRHGMSANGTYGFCLEWTFEGRNMADKIISKWLYLIQDGLGEALRSFVPQEGDIDKQESCATRRKLTLEGILKILEVIASLDQITRSTPRTVFRAAPTVSQTVTTSTPMKGGIKK